MLNGAMCLHLLLNFLLFRATPLNTFTDYIRGGCQINLMVAIDFTVSPDHQLHMCLSFSLPSMYVYM